ncbi:hypothetical protein UNSWDHB_1010 [Dehalobacter sp. UNSWDHB]|uniref:bifunctional glycosyltransferase family 2/GtrA family protein n=1 Tax=unclassified Dehalobacter TaxID=2635733 RepID=UPI00028A4A1C|nr:MULTISPECIES: bifunctional glycosyltransferase family 2/GtrA family protein [unclassified Dehalobacter]AFV03786.1 Glycosyltransferase involved in cell wall biogenesis [Dehalobacter sp. DCA]AFV06772.1 Glycosyltransferase involved in cell wall biogenesis [Dehalobacter sp. CF]EQB21697.1 hypothetical protein UNSWDHB_1010 [Dehalobacter sp. UNSWDHB]
MTILIPAYEPDERLLRLIEDIKEKCDFQIVIVDDGSGKPYSKIFQAAGKLGCTVLTHPANEGKGAALKTGFRYIKEKGEKEGVICADSDGQHLPEDIIRVAQVAKERREFIVLGSRKFCGKVPPRSRFGNTVTRAVFSVSSGSHLTDTQTGLRGYSADMLDWLGSIQGKRFEYEMNILLEAKAAGYLFYEVWINTVYDEKNRSSHFRTFSDSARVYYPILKFCTSSLMSGALDFALLLLFQFSTSNLLIAVVGARVCSSIFNYSMNHYFVFSRNKSTEHHKSAPKYFSLVVFIMACNYGLMYLFHILIGAPLVFAKIITELTLFLFSYWSQRNFVFSSEKKPLITANKK